MIIPALTLNDTTISLETLILIVSDSLPLVYVLLSRLLAGRREPDQESEADAYSQGHVPSSDNLMGTPRSGVPLVDPHSSTQTFTSDAAGGGSYTHAKEPYPAWSTERQIPLSKE